MLALALIVAALLLLVRPHVALAVERWRRQHGHEVRVWVETIAQFEALSSLAGYRYEHEDDPFPEIVPPDAGSHAGALFEGVQLGHPLLPRAAMVPNDVRLAGETQLLVVSGSNMSGKSTLLRTVGINAVMALAGAPVRAVSLRLSPLAVGATLRIQDSLLEGRSRFYCGDHPDPDAGGYCGRSRTAAFPARRAPPRHQLARPAGWAPRVSCAACSIAERSD